MQGREYLFPDHLNRDEVEKEYRIWYHLEQQLREDQRNKRKLAKALETQRAKVWDTLKYKHLSVTPTNPGPDDYLWRIRDDRKKEIRDEICYQRIQERAKEDRYRQDSDGTKSSDSVEHNWSTKRDEYNAIVKRQLIEHKRQECLASTNHISEKIASRNSDWSDSRAKKREVLMSEKRIKKEFHSEATDDWLSGRDEETDKLKMKQIEENRRLSDHPKRNDSWEDKRDRLSIDLDRPRSTDSWEDKRDRLSIDLDRPRSTDSWEDKRDRLSLDLDRPRSTDSWEDKRDRLSIDLDRPRSTDSWEDKHEQLSLDLKEDAIRTSMERQREEQEWAKRRDSLQDARWKRVE